MNKKFKYFIRKSTKNIKNKTSLLQEHFAFQAQVSRNIFVLNCFFLHFFPLPSLVKEKIFEEQLLKISLLPFEG